VLVVFVKSDENKYINFKLSILSIYDSFGEHNKKRLLLAISVSDELDSNDAYFRLYQTLKEALWEKEEAITMGFEKYIEENIFSRSVAVKYHDLNRNECNQKCQICIVRKRWNL
tara:strand:+ start:9 stop:350 length:342 start_codon:yes stop_codon:yes gene_type:complete